MKVLHDYLTSYSDEDTHERLQELIDEANRLIEVSALGERKDLIQRQFLIWNESCRRYFDFHSNLFVGKQDLFARAGKVPMLPKAVEILSEEANLIDKIQSELQSRLSYLIEAKQDISSSDLPKIKISERSIVRLGSENQHFTLSGKKLEMVLVMQDRVPQPIPMEELATLVGYSKANQRKVSDDKRELNESFRVEMNLETDLVVRVGKKGYSLNVEELSII